MLKFNLFEVPHERSLPESIFKMRELENHGYNTPGFVSWVKNNFGNNCRDCIPFEIWEYIQKNFVYKSDDPYDELFISPVRLPVLKHGDCDDFSIFIKTVLTILNIKSYYILLGSEKNKYSHVAIYCNGKIIDGANVNFNLLPKKYKWFTLIN